MLLQVCKHGPIESTMASYHDLHIDFHIPYIILIPQFLGRYVLLCMHMESCSTLDFIIGGQLYTSIATVNKCDPICKNPA